MEQARILMWDEMDLPALAKAGEPRPQPLPRKADFHALEEAHRKLRLLGGSATRTPVSHYV